MSDTLLYALGEADANTYLCSKDLRPSENRFYLFFCIVVGTHKSLQKLWTTNNFV